uniref:NFKB inhibitor interacting Ras like 2 n=1 Tax=Suricata suricatta TaxID=37032 RepID=A0A673VJ72_SURSU
MFAIGRKSSQVTLLLSRSFMLCPKSSSPARLSVPGPLSSAPYFFLSLVDWPIRIHSVTHVSHLPCFYKFSPHLVPGSEMIETQEDIYVGSIETDRGVREQVRFYDTRGLRDGAELPRHCFSCTDGYVLVYSTDSRESFQRVELLKKEIDKSKDKKEVTIVVLGNKCDLQEQRRVDLDVAQHWAKSEKVKLWEVSVADRRSLLEPFVYLASKMTQPQSKSAFPLSRKNKGSGSLDG